MPQQVSKEEAHLFEEANVIDVGIVNEESPGLDASTSAHISSPGRLMHKSRRNSNSASPPNLSDTILEMDASDGDEVSIATTVSSDSIQSAVNDNKILSQYAEVDFEMADHQDFVTEINDWFVMNDLAKLSKVRLIFHRTVDVGNFTELSQEAQASTVRTIHHRLQLALEAQDFQALTKHAICLNYLAMGCFDEITDEEHQKTTIMQILALFLSADGLYETLIEAALLCLNQLASDTVAADDKLLEFSMALNYILTVLYFTLCFVAERESQFYASFQVRDRFVTTLDETQLLEKLTKAVDTWRWLGSEAGTQQAKAKQAIKVRSIIIVITKLVLVQFGGLDHMKSTKKFLKQRLDKSSTSSDTDYKVSPLDYHFYTEELRMRYPSFIPPESSLSRQVETNIEAMEALSLNDESAASAGARSVSESLMDEPFSSRRVAAVNDNNQQPPDVHIATPAPSPTFSPINVDTWTHTQYQDRFSNEFKDSKKTFQNTPSFPYLHPADDSVPTSIEEATKIFFNSVKEDITTKQFMSVYEDFIVQERGIINTFESEKESFHYTDDDIAELPEFQDEIKSLMRVENYYRTCLPYMNSLVKVLIQSIESSCSVKHEKSRGFNQAPDKNMTREELSKLVYESKPSQVPNFLKTKYEIDRVKEVTLKNSSQLLHYLLKWFKLSHVLKFEFLSMIIFDNNYYQTTLDFLLDNFEYTATHMYNHNELLLENLNIDDDDFISQQFGDDELAILKYQFHSQFSYNKVVKEEFDIPDYRFFDRCLELSSNPEKDLDPAEKYRRKLELFKEQDEIMKDQNEQKQHSLAVYYGINNPKLIIYNWKYCFTLTNLLNVLYYTMNNKKTQRVNQLIEKKATDLLKFCLRLHNKFYYRPILKIIKLIIPFNGRKWRSNNMDSISLVYLYYKVGLKDEWLTKNYNNPTFDIAEEFKRSYKQEYSLRSLLQYYNIKYYQKEMADLGYEYFEMDYFNRELDILSRSYLTSQNQQSG